MNKKRLIKKYYNIRGKLEGIYYKETEYAGYALGDELHKYKDNPKELDYFTFEEWIEREDNE